MGRSLRFPNPLPTTNLSERREFKYVLLHDIEETFRLKMNQIHCETQTKLVQAEIDGNERFESVTKSDFDDMMAESEEIEDVVHRRIQQRKMWHSWHTVSNLIF